MLPETEFAIGFRNHLTERGYAPRGGNTDKKIAAFERMCRVQLPIDLRECLRVMNGTEGDGDDLMTTFAAIHEFRPLLLSYDGLPRPAFIVIANQMISAPDFAIDLSGGKPAVVRAWEGIDSVEPVADSFTDFVRLFMGDPWKIHIHDFGNA